MGLKIGSRTLKSFDSSLNKPRIKCGNVYHALTTDISLSEKPRLKLRINNKDYYTQTIFGYSATTIFVHQRFNNGDGTSSTMEFREISVYDSSGVNVVSKFSPSELVDCNSKASMRAGILYGNVNKNRPFYKWLFDGNPNSGIQGYVTRSNDGQARYELTLRAPSAISISKIEIRFGRYNDSSGHDGHVTYVDLNGSRVYYTSFRKGYLRIVLEYKKDDNGVFKWVSKTFSN